MEMPLTIVIAVVVSVIILLVVIFLAIFVKDAGQQAIQYIWNIPEYIRQLLKSTPSNEAPGGQ